MMIVGTGEEPAGSGGTWKSRGGTCSGITICKCITKSEIMHNFTKGLRVGRLEHGYIIYLLAYSNTLFDAFESETLY